MNLLCSLIQIFFSVVFDLTEIYYLQNVIIKDEISKTRFSWFQKVWIHKRSCQLFWLLNTIQDFYNRISCLNDLFFNDEHSTLLYRLFWISKSNNDEHRRISFVWLEFNSVFRVNRRLTFFLLSIICLHFAFHDEFFNLNDQEI